MKRMMMIGVVLLLAVTAAFADVTQYGPAAWTQLPGGQGAYTFVMPAANQPGGCGSENGNTCEVTGYFDVGAAFTTTGEWQILDADGITVSDQVFWDNGPGFAAVAFYSDPELYNSGGGYAPDPLQGTLCIEDNVNGCVGTFGLQLSDGTNISINVGSDGESYFDPFGAGYDTSDGIEFTPEPTSVLLLAGVVGLLGRQLVRRRRAA